MAHKDEPACPVCGADLEYDEVDIGVGVQQGNFRCEQCGWTPRDPLEDIEAQREAEADAQCAAYDAHPDREGDDGD